MKAFAALLLVAALLLPSVPTHAGGDPKSCLMTVVEVQIRKTSGEWITIFRGEKDVDVVSEEAGVTIENRDGSIPEGQYENAKIIFSEKIRFVGRDGENKTKPGGSLVLSGTVTRSADIDQMEITGVKVSAPVWTVGDEEGEITQHLDFDYSDRDLQMEIFARRPFVKKLNVKKGSVIRVGLNIDMRGRILFAWPNFFTGFASPEIVYLLPPKEVAELWMKVDGVTTLSTRETIEWTF